MPGKKAHGGKATDTVVRVIDVSQKTSRKELIWLKGDGQELDVFRIPMKYLYFNIENGRYADKMIQLKADHPEAEIDPREEKWKNDIWKMLKGEYAGTEKDKEPFHLLKKDLLARKQLRPGVVLSDGGVLDGNRRFAVLRDLHATEANPSRFEYFDAVILPKDVGEEDRWRIEAGLQIGKDDKLDYSPINRLLKIKEGMELFKNARSPAQEIANTLIGISKPEVEWDIEKIKLIDSYLEFIRKPNAYNLVSGVVERFEEALNAMEAAKKAKLPPERVSALRTKLFSAIRFATMTNWEMRDIRLAIGAPGKNKSSRHKNDKALQSYLHSDVAIKELREALVAGNPNSEVAKREKENADKFLDEMAASKAVDEPARLVQRAQTNLQQLLETLGSGQITNHKGWERTIKPLPEALKNIIELATKCAERAKTIHAKK